VSDRISTRIDATLKQNASNILHQIGLSESDAIRMFYTQIVMHRGLPFEAKVPNDETLAAFEELDQEKNTLSRKLFSDFENTLDLD
jgi:DNA-damage-inducible protein J